MSFDDVPFCAEHFHPLQLAVVVAAAVAAAYVGA